MLLLSFMFLVATTIALPVIPDPPSLPVGGSDGIIVVVPDPGFEMNPSIPEIKSDEMKDVEKNNDEISLSSIPPPPELPPFDMSILRSLNEDNIRPEADKNSETKETEPVAKSKEEAKEIKVPADAKNEEKPIPAIVFSKPEMSGIVKLEMPNPPFLTNIMQSLPSLPIPISYPILNWPPQIPSYFKPPHLRYPNFIIEDESA